MNLASICPRWMITPRLSVKPFLKYLFSFFNSLDPFTLSHLLSLMSVEFFKDKSVIIFDFDGTLVNSMSDFADIAANVMQRNYGCAKEWARLQYRLTSGIPFSFQLEEIYPGDCRNPLVSREFETLKAQNYLNSPFYDDMEPTLLSLKKRGYFLSISSNNHHSLVYKRLGDKAKNFDCIVGFEPQFMKGKDHFDFICRKRGVSFKEMVFVGDSLKDGHLAFENGIHFIAKTGVFTAEDFFKQGIAERVVDSLSELKHFFVHAKRTGEGCDLGGRLWEPAST